MRNFELHSLLMMALDDEMPTAPAAAGEVPATPVQTFTGEIAGESLDAVPEMGEPLPQGTYHFRLERYIDGWSDAPKPDKDPFNFGPQPWMMLFWHAQQEPVVGRVFTDFAQWVNNETAQAANDKSNPLRQQAAQTIINDRCWKAKAVAVAAGYKPTPGSGFNVKTFFATNPEVKISISIGPRKVKNASGKYENDPSGKKQNKLIDYLPLFDHRAAQQVR